MYIVIDKDGDPSYDREGNPEEFFTMVEAEARAQELAKLNIEEETSIYKKVKTIKFKIGDMVKTEC